MGMVVCYVLLTVKQLEPSLQDTQDEHRSCQKTSGTGGRYMLYTEVLHNLFGTSTRQLAAATTGTTNLAVGD